MLITGYNRRMNFNPESVLSVSESQEKVRAISVFEEERGEDGENGGLTIELSSTIMETFGENKDALEQFLVSIGEFLKEKLEDSADVKPGDVIRNEDSTITIRPFVPGQEFSAETVEMIKRTVEEESEKYE